GPVGVWAAFFELQSMHQGHRAKQAHKRSATVWRLTATRAPRPAEAVRPPECVHVLLGLLCAILRFRSGSVWPATTRAQYWRGQIRLTEELSRFKAAVNGQTIPPD